MPKNRWFRAVMIVSVVSASAAAFPANALAAAPVFHDKIHLTVPGVDLCGFLGTLRITGTQVITVTDTQVKVTGQVSQVFTAANGNVVTISSSGQFTGTFTQSGDTITFVTTYKGLPERISSRGTGGTVLRDAGVISFITTIDLVTGDVTDNVIVKGPHPEADSGFTLFCAAVTDAPT